MSADPYVLIVRPDPQTPGRFLAQCPDIPGWFATGDSPAEASTMGAEIVRGIVSERQARGADLPEVHMRAVHVTVDAPARPAPPAGQADAEQETPDSPLASFVAQTRAQRLAEDGAHVTPMTPGRVLKSGSFDSRG